MKCLIIKLIYSLLIINLCFHIVLTKRIKSKNRLKTKTDNFTNGFSLDELLQVCLGIGSVILKDDYSGVFYTKLNDVKHCSEKLETEIDTKIKNVEKETFNNDAEIFLTNYLKEKKMTFPEFKKKSCDLFDEVATECRKKHNNIYDDFFARKKKICEDYNKNENKVTDMQTYEGKMKLPNGGNDDLISAFSILFKKAKKYMINITNCVFDKKVEVVNKILPKLDKSIGQRVSNETVKKTNDIIMRSLAGGIVGGIKMAYYKQQINFNLYKAYHCEKAATDKFYRLGKVAGYIMKIITEIASKEKRVLVNTTPS